MHTTNPIVLQQDGRAKLKVSIPADMAEHEISRVMRYKTRLNHPTYVARLYAEGSAKFNDAIELLYPKYGVKA